MKLLFWIALIALVWFALREKSRKRHQSAAAGRAAERTRSGAPEQMLQCRQCGVYFPASEAASNAFGDVFCSEEHLRLFRPESR